MYLCLSGVVFAAFGETAAERYRVKASPGSGAREARGKKSELVIRTHRRLDV